MKLSEFSDGRGNGWVGGASAATINRTKQLTDAFDLDDDLSGTPTEAFRRTIENLDDKQREALMEVARRAFRLGAKRGAIEALNAVIDGTISTEPSGGGAQLTTEAKALAIPSRKLRIFDMDQGDDLVVSVQKFKVSVEKLGFEWSST